MEGLLDAADVPLIVSVGNVVNREIAEVNEVVEALLLKGCNTVCFFEGTLFVVENPKVPNFAVSQSFILVVVFRSALVVAGVFLNKCALVDGGAVILTIGGVCSDVVESLDPAVLT